MLRRLLLPFLVAVALVAPIAAPAPAAAQSAPEAVASDVNAFWAGEFAAAGLAYSPPGFVSVTGESST